MIGGTSTDQEVLWVRFLVGFGLRVEEQQKRLLGFDPLLCSYRDIITESHLKVAETDKRLKKIEHKQTAPFVHDEAEQEGQAGQQVQPGNRALKKTVCRCSAKI